MSRETQRVLAVIQLVVEICIAAGFLFGLLPFVYLWSSGWVVPLTFISLLIGFITRNGTALFAGINVGMALLSFIPVLGFITRLIGAFISLLNISSLRRLV